jgi:DNA primase
VASILTLTFDGDQAGLQAAERVAELPKPALSGLSLHVARLPEHSDPASLLTAGKADLFREAIANSRPLVHHLIDRDLSHHNLEEPEALVRALRSIGPLVTHLTGPADRAQTVTYLAERVGRSEDIIESALESYSRSPRRERERIAGRTLS